MTGRLAVLTPVRNGADDVPDYLKSVERFADLVIALDDGSTDETRAMLEASPIVAETLTNPMRPSFAGWDDAANRQRLLDALAFFDDVEWVFFLDVDERLDEADAAALRRFIEQDAYAGFAYGFEVVRMAGGLDRFDADSGMWVYRMFGYESGLELARTRLHFVPIPVSIDRRRWIRTTVRIQHVGGATQDRRIKRFRKYQEADPDLDYQASYDALLDAPAKVREWSSRLPTTPVVVSNETQFASAVGELEQTELERPALSAVVISHNDEDTIARSVQALVDQEITDPVEIIVVTSGTDRTADIVEAGFPSVRVIRLPRKAFPGEARNAGLWVARGHYISFPGSHIVVAPGSLQARLEAHEAGWDLVTGTTLNGNPTTAGWASYFLDHSSVMPDRPSGELSTAPAHCSYLRSDLDEVGGFPENMRAGEDTVVNLELFRRGRRAYRSGDAGIVHTSRARTLSQMVRHHFGRGRAWGRILLSRSGSRRKLLQTGLRPMLTAPLTRTRIVARHVTTWGGGLRSEYRRARLHVAAGAVAAAFGTSINEQPGRFPPWSSPTRARRWHPHSASSDTVPAPRRRTASAGMSPDNRPQPRLPQCT
jgi:glycosyltransferase involved in cell wall biosynthesis